MSSLAVAAVSHAGLIEAAYRDGDKIAYTGPSSPPRRTAKEQA